MTGGDLSHKTYPPVMTNSLRLKVAIEIVDLPHKKSLIFHSYVNVSQRVSVGWFSEWVPGRLTAMHLDFRDQRIQGGIWIHMSFVDPVGPDSQFAGDGLAQT